MIDYYELILAGKNIVFNVEGFFDYVCIDVEFVEKMMFFKEGFLKLLKLLIFYFFFVIVYNG